MPKFRKKPVVIEAMQHTEDTGHSVYAWVEDNTQGSFDPRPLDGFVPESGVSIDPETGNILIARLGVAMPAQLGDWIIRDVNGEFYPCKPDIFEKTYDIVTEE